MSPYEEHSRIPQAAQNKKYLSFKEWITNESKQDTHEI
ncbi:hypothetical protein SD77_0191 [Bacillus badius]|uniref:Uncharacterized protein n=1 Tax=Bacillus badius TaxID=1455 RepID=A0ABR5B1H0_BACBA|nr:hypothetical protein SD78_3523 [Bacillus badius]KIL80343.1 hypothetical protein SD77_0191 [Bacillus badius]